MPETNGGQVPAYKRIQDVIIQRLEAGYLTCGDMVPSERKLAEVFNVSLMTARHAMVELERAGIVERRRGVGTFVSHLNNKATFHKRRPAYQYIQKAIVERIDTGNLKPADMVASERELAGIHNVSLMTARQALVGLASLGIVERQQGIGTFVSRSGNLTPGATYSVRLHFAEVYFA